MIDNGSNEDINKDDPAKQYDHLLKRYATLTSGDVMFIWKRASKITIIADKASLLRQRTLIMTGTSDQLRSPNVLTKPTLDIFHFHRQR